MAAVCADITMNCGNLRSALVGKRYRFTVNLWKLKINVLIRWMCCPATIKPNKLRWVKTWRSFSVFTVFCWIQILFLWETFSASAGQIKLNRYRPGNVLIGAFLSKRFYRRLITGCCWLLLVFTGFCSTLFGCSARHLLWFFRKPDLFQPALQD